VNAELAARRTAAAAVVADFRRWAEGGLVAGHWQDWSLRLALAVESLTEVSPAVLNASDLRTVLDALDVAADYKRGRLAICSDDGAHPEEPCATCAWRLHVADEYDALARRIGDTQ
jgi:hypothetical protein